MADAPGDIVPGTMTEYLTDEWGYFIKSKREYERFTGLLDEGFDDSTPGPELTEATGLGVGALLAKIYEEILLDRVAELPSLLPDLTYEFLVPFVGEEAARAEQRAAAA